MSHAQSKRFIGLDGQQAVVLRPRRVSLVEFEGWAGKVLQPTDQVILEATSNAWYVYDLLEPLVQRIAVVNPHPGPAVGGQPGARSVGAPGRSAPVAGTDAYSARPPAAATGRS